MHNNERRANDSAQKTMTSSHETNERADITSDERAAAPETTKTEPWKKNEPKAEATTCTRGANETKPDKQNKKHKTIAKDTPTPGSKPAGRDPNA